MGLLSWGLMSATPPMQTLDTIASRNCATTGRHNYFVIGPQGSDAAMARRAYVLVRVYYRSYFFRFFGA